VKEVDFLGVRVDDVTLDDAVEAIEGFMREGGPHQVATVNPEFVMAARRSPEFKLVLNSAALCVPDGVGLIWGSRLIRRPLRARVPGVDLIWRLADVCAERGWSMFMLGGFEGVGALTAGRFREQFPGLRIAGTYEGGPGDPASVERVRAAQPEVPLVAFGAPAQDLWIHSHAAELNVPVCIGVGGSFDFIAGRAKRAPGWLQRLGLEWLHRLAREPWRWRRQLVLPHFAILMLRQRWNL